jgi:hypothetical protein
VGATRAAASAPTRLVAAGFAVLVIATFGAFFLASRLKAEPAVLADLQRLRYFSPNGDGRRDVQRIRFRAELDDRAAVDIVDADGARVRRVEDDLRIRSGRTAVVTWNGRDDDGARAPDGRYRMRLILRGEGRAVLSGKGFELDTRPPDPAVLVDRDDPIVTPGAPVRFRVRGAGVSSAPRFRVLRTDLEPPREVRRLRGEPGVTSYTWDGRDDAGRLVPPGTYLIAVSSRDKAGNEGQGPPLPLAPGRIEGRPGVTVRRLAVQPPVRPVRAGALTAFRVDARGRPYRWSVRRLGTGTPVLANKRPKRGTTLLVRAPRGRSGVYLLEVRSGGASAALPFAVQANVSQAALRGRPLVVLPMISWLGRDPLDDSAVRDGLPDRFSTGADVRFPRLFAFEGGLPGGFAAGVAPLLVWLDRNDVRYDVTTDLDLALGGALDPERRRGLLFAGSPAWTSRGLARRLRRFVDAGGRVALVGTDALRAGVTVRDGRLTSATPPEATDAFGARLAPRRLTGPLSVLDEDPQLGLLEGFSGVLGGFTRAEELVSPGPRGRVATSVAEAISEQEAAKAEEENRTLRPERPAISAVRSGDGLVLRLGLPDWVARLARRDPAVTQITFNVVDLLRGARPRARSAR